MKESWLDHTKLGELLLESALIDSDQLNEGIKKSKKDKSKLGEALVTLGFISEDILARTLSTQLGLPYIDLEKALIEQEAVELVSEKLARKYTLIPLHLEKDGLHIAMANPLEFDAIKDLVFTTDKNVMHGVAPADAITEAIKRHYHLAEPVEDIIKKMGHGDIEVIPEGSVNVTQSLEDLVEGSESPPIIRMVNSIIFAAVKNRASDIHIEPREENVIVRERVDGILADVQHLPKWVQGSITSRIKIIAGMDIAEKRIPQDGRIKIRVEEREIDLRISALPIQHGESVVIRILDTQCAVVDLDDIGMLDRDLERILGIIERPQGVVLLTGPTGCGKTSTLYAMINRIKSDIINIISLEDPIEYELGGVNQVAINEKTGLTFAYGLRSMLRQDPDVILVGEMRDPETAEIAVQSSLTGHLVLSTLHTNTSVAAITRLANLGVKPYLIASSLNGIVAQRLVRKLCPGCKEPHTPALADLLKIGLREADAANIKFYRNKGCEDCNETGYMGRTGVFEVLICDKNTREVIADNGTEEEIMEAATSGGMKLLLEDGIEKIKSGITSLDEIFRVIYVEEEKGLHLCHSCGEFVRIDFMRCPYCGIDIVSRCPGCNKVREKGWKNCPYCSIDFKSLSG